MSHYTRPSVLIVEDDPYDVEIVRNAFKDTPVELVIAKTANEGFQAAATRMFSIVFLDLKLPDSTDPVALIKTMKSIAPNSVIAILTAAVEPSLEPVLSQFALVVILKPLTREMVRDTFNATP